MAQKFKIITNFYQDKQFNRCIDSKNNLPEILYHYTSKNSMLEILKGENLHFSHLFYQNDQLEFIFFQNQLNQIKIKNEIFGLAKDILRENKNIKEEKIDLFLTALINHINYYFENIYIANNILFFGLSFSKNNDSLCMWSNYTNKLGYCIGVNSECFINTMINYCGKNTSSYFDNDNSTYNNIYYWYGNIIYNEDEQLAIIKNTFQQFFEIINTDFDVIEYINNLNKLAFLPNKMIDPLTWQLLSYSLFFKNNALREENEYRFVIIIYNTNGESKDYLLKSLKFKDSNGIKIPYLDILENFSDCYKSITIGPLSNEFTPSSLDLYLKYAKDGDDKIYKVKIDREKINKSNISYRW